MEAYRAAQSGCTAWLWHKAGESTRAYMAKRHKGKPEYKLQLKWKSYLLQEGEAVSRHAKMRWCQQRGIRVTNLQHDGIATGHMVDTIEEAQTGMSQQASHACGFEVKVKGEEMLHTMTAEKGNNNRDGHRLEGRHSTLKPPHPGKTHTDSR